MKALVLTRQIVVPDRGRGAALIGRLDLMEQGSPLLTTLELPWRGNRRCRPPRGWENGSCIPDGQYVVRPRMPSAKFRYRHLLVKDVPGRTFILMHRGNWAKDTRGCILVGKSADPQNSMIKQSRAGLATLLEHLGGDWAQLTVATNTSHKPAPEGV